MTYILLYLWPNNLRCKLKHFKLKLSRYSPKHVFFLSVQSKAYTFIKNTWLLWMIKHTYLRFILKHFPIIIGNPTFYSQAYHNRANKLKRFWNVEEKHSIFGWLMLARCKVLHTSRSSWTKFGVHPKSPNQWSRTCIQMKTINGMDFIMPSFHSIPLEV